MCHYGMWNFYVKIDLKATKITGVIKLEQDYICRYYIQNNTKKKEL